MSTKSRFCPLCDVLVDVWLTPDDNLANPDYRLNWLQEVRALRTTEELEGSFITGTGWLDIEGNVIAPVEYDSHYRNYEPLQDLHQDFATHEIGYPQCEPAEYWCYVLHDACWKLLRERVDPNHEVPVNSLAHHLFAILFNTPVSAESEALVPGHNYGHASQLHPREGEVHGRYFTRVNLTSYSFITGDITEEFVPEEESLENEAKYFYAYLANSYTKHRNYSKPDPFLLLPSELIVLILAQLPSRDVCNLRLASRYTADRSSPEFLDQKFWSSRFGPDFEMGFVFAGLSNSRPAEPADWRALYLKAKGALKSELFHGLRNRHRIWHIFQHMTDALYVRLANDPCGDDPPYWNLEPFPQRPVFAEASFYSCSTTIKRPLSLSCRLFRRQNLVWPHSLGSIPQRLRASFVYSNGKTYISGFHFLAANPGDPAPQKVGFINPRKGHEISLEPQSSIEYIEAVMETKGLVGLRFHIRGIQSSYSVSIGDMELTEPQSGIGRLTPGDNMQCVGFHFALDACKIISISLIEQPVPASLAPINSRAVPVSPQEWCAGEIWNPSIPTVHPTWPFPAPLITQYFNLCLNMDFGGTDGKLLQSLVRIDVFMGKYPSVFTGISFIYNDRSERFYGRKNFRNSLDEIIETPAIRQCFPIDGPGGEVITKIIAYYYPDTVQAITITTSLGREKHFHLYGKEYGETEEKSHVLQAEPGNHFTAFYAKVHSPLGHFLDFSARRQVINTDSQLPLLGNLGITHSIPITAETLDSAQDMLAYPRGFAITAADFSRLRRIRVSIDNIKEITSPRHITGLWLEYDNSTIPVIVGQWVNELDAIDITPGDRISEVITWHDYTNPYKRIKYGPLRRLRIVTARGVSKEFLEDHKGGEICLEYRENPYEILSGILWGYNHEWDHVRIFYTPKIDASNTQLLIGSAGYLLPSWSVVQRAFMQETCEDGRLNPAIAIEVTFRQITNEICGLSLIYENGKFLTLGIGVKGATRIDIPADEKLAQVEIGGTRQNHILYINFLTASGRKIDLSRLSVENINKRVVNRTIYILDRSCPGRPKIAETKVYQVPEGANILTGFWTLPRRRGGLRYGRFGPIFESISDKRLAGL